MTRTRQLVALGLGLEALLSAFLVFALLDRRAHESDTVHGFNQWGYRDEARGSKEPGEIRVALVGGSAAFERQLPAAQTLAGRLYIELRQAGAPVRQLYSVVNLSEPHAGADTYMETLRDYEYLQPDAVVVFDGYDVLLGEPAHGRRRSAVYRAAGYLPMLPSKLLRQPQWLSDPDEGIAPLLRDDARPAADAGCDEASAAYCAAIADTVRFALSRQHAVLVVSPPFVSSRHATQQRSLARFLDRGLAGEPRFRYLDLGNAVPLSDPVHSTDGLHRTEIGNHVVAQRIAGMLLPWIGTPGILRSRGSGS
jgi:hypothetical protein